MENQHKGMECDKYTEKRREEKRKGSGYLYLNSFFLPFAKQNRPQITEAQREPNQ